MQMMAMMMAMMMMMTTMMMILMIAIIVVMMAMMKMVPKRLFCTTGHSDYGRSTAPLTNYHGEIPPSATAERTHLHRGGRFPSATNPSATAEVAISLPRHFLNRQLPHCW